MSAPNARRFPPQKAPMLESADSILILVADFRFFFFSSADRPSSLGISQSAILFLFPFFLVFPASLYKDGDENGVAAADEARRLFLYSSTISATVRPSATPSARSSGSIPSIPASWQASASRSASRTSFSSAVVPAPPPPPEAVPAAVLRATHSARTRRRSTSSVSGGASGGTGGGGTGGGGGGTCTPAVLPTLTPRPTGALTAREDRPSAWGRDGEGPDEEETTEAPTTTCARWCTWEWGCGCCCRRAVGDDESAPALSEDATETPLAERAAGGAPW
mmetsp:Transcript_14413/g.27426  ORF Transcript_14413/g.27426 Transcript_14413/m.27426 type:complete len:278 (+) Transcript_14413:61-894(+)